MRNRFFFFALSMWVVGRHALHMNDLFDLLSLCFVSDGWSPGFYAFLLGERAVVDPMLVILGIWRHFYKGLS
jgi:hypothetical protein